MADNQTLTIDSAIRNIDDYIQHNQRAQRMIFNYLIAFSAFMFGCGIALYVELKIKDPILIYASVGIFFMVFGVLMAVYRFHLNEIAKAEHNKIGFMRIRVAANNYKTEGFQSEVRQSLTEKAFDYSPHSSSIGKKKGVESPIPGHPSSDLSAIMLNKILEGLEVRKKP